MGCASLGLAIANAPVVDLVACSYLAMRAQSLLTAAVLLCSLVNCLPHVASERRDGDSIEEVADKDEETGVIVAPEDDKGGPPGKLVFMFLCYVLVESSRPGSWHMWLSEQSL